MNDFRPDEDFARRLDEADPLASFRERFHLPTRNRDTGNAGIVYFCGNSLGLQPASVKALIEQELDDWAKLAVDAHFEGRTPWYSYHEVFRESGAQLVGANPGEVVMMNSLTVNLHLMMVTFYHPTRDRYKILVDYPTFPSDSYAIRTQLRYHGFDPDDGLILLKPRVREYTLRFEDIESLLEKQGEQIALVFFSGVNFFTGQWFDIPRMTRLAQERGCVVGWDLAHAAGNIPLALHDWNVDFAVWCNYKYMNAGPGAIGGCFVHQRHGQNIELPRLAGWWGNDPKTRFRMHCMPEFVPQCGAEGWQISNPPILSMVPLRASLELFDEVSMELLHSKSLLMNRYMDAWLERLSPARFEVITPKSESERGCQISMLAKNEPKVLFTSLQRAGIVGDFREPDVIRIAPVPLYNSFHDIWRLAQVLAKHVAD